MSTADCQESTFFVLRVICSTSVLHSATPASDNSRTTVHINFVMRAETLKAFMEANTSAAADRKTVSVFIREGVLGKDAGHAHMDRVTPLSCNLMHVVIIQKNAY